MTISADCEVRDPLPSHGSRLNEQGLLTSLRGPEALRQQVIADYLHDLRTPLVALRGYAKMLQEERIGTLNALQKNYTQTIVENSQRLVRVLNELSQVAAMEPMAFEKVDVRSLFKQILSSFGGRRSLHLVFGKENCNLEDPYIWGDPQQLTEALGEILTRIIDAAPPLAEIEVALSQLGEQIHIVVSLNARSPEKGIEPGGATDGEFVKSPVRTSLDRIGGISVAEAVIILHGGHLISRSESPTDPAIRLVLPTYVATACKEKES